MRTKNRYKGIGDTREIIFLGEPDSALNGEHRKVFKSSWDRVYMKARNQPRGYAAGYPKEREQH